METLSQSRGGVWCGGGEWKRKRKLWWNAPKPGFYPRHHTKMYKKGRWFLKKIKVFFKDQSFFQKKLIISRLHNKYFKAKHKGWKDGPVAKSGLLLLQRTWCLSLGTRVRQLQCLYLASLGTHMQTHKQKLNLFLCSWCLLGISTLVCITKIMKKVGFRAQEVAQR